MDDPKKKLDKQEDTLTLTRQRLDIDGLMGLPQSIIPKFYANGFTIGNSLSDATVVSLIGNNPVAVITMSFTAMKSLYNALGNSINEIEKGLGHPIMDNLAIAEVWQKNTTNLKTKEP